MWIDLFAVDFADVPKQGYYLMQFYFETNNEEITLFKTYWNEGHSILDVVYRSKQDELPSILFKNLPAQYEDWDKTIKDEFEDFEGCVLSGLWIDCGVIPGAEPYMDFTTMVLITDLNTNFNTFFDLEEFNFYSLTGNEGTYITEEIELKMEIGQKCGITCIPENFSCK